MPQAQATPAAPGGEPPWLRDALDQLHGYGDRLPHALLIQGPGGWGEERVANALAVDLMGLAPGALARDVAHPDMRYLEPEDGIIKVDAVRRVIDFVVQTPKYAGRKIAVIRDADRMNVNAANALLKTLEAPPPESYLVLTTGAPERLPATLRSRCQRIEVHAAPADQAMAWLAAAGVDDTLGGQLAIEYGGAPFAILAAADRGQAPLWPALAQSGRAPAAAREIAEARRDEDLADLVGRWLRIVHWLLRRLPPDSLDPALDFAAELARVRRMALLNTGLNRSLQLLRLLLLWAELWPRLAAAEIPNPAP